MKKNTLLSFLLALAIMLSAVAFSGTAALADSADVDAQVNFIASQLDKLLQNDGVNTWYYAVTDLDRDGNLEFIAASLHPQNRATNLKVWEVSADRTAMEECSLVKDPEESFPDMMTDTADTYHDTATDTWYYMFYDNIVISPTEVYTIKTAVNLKNGAIDYDAYAVEHTLVQNGWFDVTYTDENGSVISAEQFNASGVNAFAGAERSSTNFDWITADKVNDVARLADSYAVFSGAKEPTEIFPVPRPAAVSGTADAAQTPDPYAAPIPAATPVPSQNSAPAYLMITKNPTNEYRKAGSTALFVACANAYESLTWTMVSPDGGEYSPERFAYMFVDAPVSGQYSTTLSIGNVAWDMDGWGAYCTFYYKGQTARTNTAYICFQGDSAPAPAPAPVPQTVYGSMSGTAYSGGGGYAINLVNGTQVFVDAWNCNVSGTFYEGATCTVYYTEPFSANSIYQADIYGSIYVPEPEPYVEPTGSGAMSGNAYEGGGGYAITLADGTQVFVDAWNCNVSGTFYDGAPCTVYYNGYPSNSTIYQVDIYG